MPRVQGLMPAIVLAATFGFAAPGLAQTTLSLPTPTDAPAAAASPTAKPQTTKKTTRARKGATQTDDGLGLATTAGRPARRSEPNYSDRLETAKPRRFVPEEFDNDDNGPKPTMSGGRAGMGMRF